MGLPHSAHVTQRRYSPFQVGLRFSAKAASPSLASAVSKRRKIPSRSSESALSSDISSPCFATSLISPMAARGPPARVAANAIASGSNWSAATSRSTIPGAGAEEFRQVRHQHHGGDRLVETDLIDGGIEVIDELPVIRIRRRAIEVNEGDAALLPGDRHNPGRGGRLLHRSLLFVRAAGFPACCVP